MFQTTPAIQSGAFTFQEYESSESSGTCFYRAKKETLAGTGAVSRTAGWLLKLWESKILPILKFNGSGSM